VFDRQQSRQNDAAARREKPFLGHAAMPRLGMNVHPHYAATHVARIGGRSVRRLRAPGNGNTAQNAETLFLRVAVVAAVALFAGGAFALARLLSHLV
jgi:hypothetical protein